jgi:tetratricopeptide (TPR) repeat protein
MRTFFAWVLLSGCLPHRVSPPPVDARASFEAGVALLQRPGRDGVPDYEAAYLRFVEAEQAGAGPRASYDAGWVAERLGRAEDALRHYRRAADQAPDYEAAVRSLLPLLVQPAPDEAVARARALAQRRPDLEQVLLDMLIEVGRHDEALTLARELLRERPDQAGVYEAMARMYAAAGQPALAALCAERALILQPGAAGALNELGVLALAQGEHAEAIARFRAALEASPGALAPNANLGLMALGSADFVRAEGLLGQASAADPDDLELQYAQALARHGTGDVRGARALLEQILEQDPSHAQAAQMLSRLEPRERSEAPAPKRQELLAQAAQRLLGTRAELARHQACLLPETAERITLLLDQVAEVVASGDLDLAADLVALLDETAADLDSAVTEQCP